MLSELQNKREGAFEMFSMQKCILLQCIMPKVRLASSQTSLSETCIAKFNSFKNRETKGLKIGRLKRV
jgi:hypothetical protein